jgi:xylulose-5-phosphate/fructose-6-phosphate phosphoketolase
VTVLSSSDEAGLRRLFLQFSFPGGIPSHASPECPGSIHEGGEGEAETGPQATAWHSDKFLDPGTDGAVLPILHFDGYKISNPTVLARITRPA